MKLNQIILIEAILSSSDSEDSDASDRSDDTIMDLLEIKDLLEGSRYLHNRVRFSFVYLQLIYLPHSR